MKNFVLVYDKNVPQNCDKQFLAKDYAEQAQFSVKNYNDLTFVHLPFVNKSYAITDITAALLASLGMTNASDIELKRYAITWCNSDIIELQGLDMYVFETKSKTATAAVSSSAKNELFSILFRPLENVSQGILPACCITQHDEDQLSFCDLPKSNVEIYASFMWRKQKVTWNQENKKEIST